MSRTNQTLELEIDLLLQRQRAIYGQAWELLAPVSQRVSGDDDLQHLLFQLNGLMDQAASNEQVLRSRWNAWEAGQFAPTDRLRTSWQAAEMELKRLIERVEQATQRAQASRDAIIPNLVTGQAHHRMRAAYGRAE